MIRFSCPLCKLVLEVQNSEAGAKCNCPQCQQRLQIPVPPPPANKTILGTLEPEPSTFNAVPGSPPLPRAVPVHQAPQAIPVHQQAQPGTNGSSIFQRLRAFAGPRTPKKIVVICGFFLILVSLISGLSVFVSRWGSGQVVRIKGEVVGQPRVLKSHKLPVEDVYWTMDGAELVSLGGYSGPRGGFSPVEMILWDAQTGTSKQSQFIKSENAFVDFLRSTDGQRYDEAMKGIRDKKLRTEVMKKQLEFRDNARGMLARSPSGVLVYWEGEAIMVCDIASGAKPRQFPGKITDHHDQEVTLFPDPPKGKDNRLICTKLSRDGSIVAFGTSDDTVTIWHHRTGKKLIRLPSKCSSLAISDDNQKLAVLFNADGEHQGKMVLKIFTLDKAAELCEVSKFFHSNRDYQSIMFSPCGSVVAWLHGPLLSPERGVFLLDASTGEERARMEGTCCAFSPDGTTLAIGTLDGEIHLRKLK